MPDVEIHDDEHVKDAFYRASASAGECDDGLYEGVPLPTDKLNLSP